LLCEELTLKHLYMKRLSILILCTLPLILSAQVAELWNVAPNGGLNRKGLVYKIYGDGSGLYEILSFDSIAVTPISPLSHHNGKIYGFGVDSAYFIYSIDVASGLFMRLQSLPAPVNKPNTCYFDEVTPVEDALYFQVGSEDTLGSTQLNVLAYHTSLDSFIFNKELDRQIGDFRNTTSTGTDKFIFRFNRIGEKLYSVASHGGASGLGTIYSLDLSTKDISKIHDFNSDSIRQPKGSLVIIEERYLIGVGNTVVNQSGMINIIYIYDIETSTISTKLDIKDILNAGVREGFLVKGYDDYIYGMSNGKYSCTPGGAKCGSLFRYDFANNFAEHIHHFPEHNSGYFPNSLIYASDAHIYGLARPYLSHKGTIFKYSPNNGSLNVLYEYTDTSVLGEQNRLTLVDVNAAPLSIFQPNEMNTQIYSYPNPAQDKLFFRSNMGKNIHQSTSVHIYDVYGRCILSEKLSSLESISIRNLPSGVYIWRMNISNKFFSDKFIKL
jgi:uncharacterized repeat protein (TIGR03803 family)